MTTSCMTPAAFNKLPRKEKAILVAKDVLEQLKQRNYKVEQGAYLANTEALIKNGEDSVISTSSPEGKKAIAETRCTVCAKGALFLSAIQRSNKMTLGEVGMIEQNYGLHQRISNKVCGEDEIFIRDNFNLIETAFECQVILASDWHIFPTKIQEKAINFGGKYKKDNVRLAAICLNIIENGGKFDPTQNIPTLEQAKKAISKKKAS